MVKTQLNVAIESSGLAGLATKNYYKLLCEEEDEDDKEEAELACVSAGLVVGFKTPGTAFYGLQTGQKDCQ